MFMKFLSTILTLTLTVGTLSLSAPAKAADVESLLAGLCENVATDNKSRLRKKLKEAGLFEKTEPTSHTVPYSSRGKVPIEPRLSMQWYVKMSELVKPAINYPVFYFWVERKWKIWRFFKSPKQETPYLSGFQRVFNSAVFFF